MKPLREVGEFEAIRRLAAGLGGAGVVVGPGDDAAVLRPSPDLDLVMTTDTFVEGRHYRGAWIGPEDLGARLAAANLSDVAAMGATPRWATVAMGVRAEHDLEQLASLQGGLVRALAGSGAVLVGGNLTAVTGEESYTLTLLGEVARDRAWRRAGARAGDLLAVTGTPGRAGAAVLWLSSSVAPAPGELLEAMRRPRSRTALVAKLAPLDAVTAAIDVSDGLAGDLSRLCLASGIGAEIDEAFCFQDPVLMRAEKEFAGLKSGSLVLGPSDDYELVLAVQPARREACVEVAAAAGVPLTFFGRCVHTPGLWIRSDHGATRPVVEVGFDHFSRDAEG
jgi:thiamine-monophosphate kinase